MLYLKKRREKRNDVDVTCFDLYLTRGDSAYIDLDISDNEGNPILPRAEDIIKCQVRDSEDDTATLIFEGQIEVSNEGKYMWHIYPEDTNTLELTEYVYDIELELSEGDVFTFIPLSKFVLLPESTRKESE